MKSRIVPVVGVLLAAILLLSACAQPQPAAAPQVIKETVVVEKAVKETVVVEKQVEKAVKETVVVEKPVEKTVVVTAQASRPERSAQGQEAGRHLPRPHQRLRLEPAGLPGRHEHAGQVWHGRRLHR